MRLFVGVILLIGSSQVKASTEPSQGEIRIGELEQVCDSLLGRELDDALSVAREALVFATSHSGAFLLERAQLLMAKTMFARSNYDSTRYYLLLAAENYTGLTPSAAINYWQGKVALKQKKYSQAMTGFYGALNIYEAMDDSKGRAQALQGISEVFSYQGDFGKAIEYGNSAIELFSEDENYVAQAMAYSEVTYNYLFQGDYDYALQQVDLAFELLARADSPPLYLATLHLLRGNIYKTQGQYELALTEYGKNLELSKAGAFPRGEMLGIGSIGHVLLLQQKYEKALPYMLRQREMMIEKGDLINLSEALLHLSDIYVGLGDYRTANEYTWAYSGENERLYEERLAEAESELTEKYEAGKREATIVLQAQRLDQQKMIQRLGVGIALTLVLLLITLFYFFRKIGKTANALRRKNEENELLLKEIHHRVKNNLELVSSLLRLQFAKTTDSTAREAMHTSQQRVESMAMIHQRLYQGKNLAAIEMRDYFRNLGENILDSFDASDQVEVVIDMNSLELDVDTAVPIGLIVNELLTNALKYAFPAQQKGIITLQMTTTADGRIHLSVADNGVGMPEDGKSIGTGFGSQLIQLLTLQLQGSVQTIVEQGTRWSFDFEQTSYA